MNSSVLIELLSVLIEVIIVAGAVFIAVKKKKLYGWAIAATFALYVCFVLSRMGYIQINARINGFMFLIANIAMLIAVWLMIKNK
jgi:hypothetical protein